MSSQRLDSLLIGDPFTATYEKPSWLSDENAILYTRNTVVKNEYNQYMVNHSEIWRYDLENGHSNKLADGIQAAYVSGKNAIVYERRSFAWISMLSH